MMDDFEGKVCLVTAAGSGIGRAITDQLVGHGARVVGLDIAAQALTQLREAYGEAVVTVDADVTEEKAVAAAVQAVVDRFGYLDLAFNVAGGGRLGPIVDLEVQDWDFVMSLVLRSVFLCTKYEGREMMRRSRGAIVNVASLNAVVPQPLGSAYASAKAGVVMFSRNAALELTPYGVRVNVVLPGLVETPATKPLVESSEMNREFTKRILLGRPAGAHEIARPCLFLASDAASYITGASLIVDGGWELTNYPDLSKIAGLETEGH